MIQQIGEKVSGTIATIATTNGVFRFTPEGYQIANLIIALVGMVGWLYFHHRTTQREDARAEAKTEHEKWLRGEKP